MKTSPESKTGLITNNGLKGRKSNQQQSDHLICEVSVVVSHCFIVRVWGLQRFFKKPPYPLIAVNCIKCLKSSQRLSIKEVNFLFVIFSGKHERLHIKVYENLSEGLWRASRKTQLLRGPGLPQLQGLLQEVCPVQIQRDLQVLQGSERLHHQPDDQEELSVLPLPEMPGGWYEAQLDPLGRGAGPEVPRAGEGREEQGGAGDQGGGAGAGGDGV